MNARSLVVRLGVLALGIYLAASHLHGKGLRVNWTDASQPAGFYHAAPTSFALPGRDQLALVVLPPQIAAVGRERGYLIFPEVGKCIAALPGDWVAVDATGITVNGHLLPGTHQLRFDREGRPLPRLILPRHRVARDEVWLYSNYSHRSWDSRYFGPVPIDAVRGILQPLYTRPRFPRDKQGDLTCNWIPTGT
jgi:conjugative transfer signal peptidase TraF